MGARDRVRVRVRLRLRVRVRVGVRVRVRARVETRRVERLFSKAFADEKDARSDYKNRGFSIFREKNRAYDAQIR